MNQWVDYNEYTGTLNLYTHDSNTEFVQKLTNELEGSTYRKQNLALTRTSICPAVLIETGFISNPVDCEYLSKDSNQKDFAEKIGAAIESYFYDLETKASNAEIAGTEVTRAEFIQTLYNLFGNGEVKDISFSDVTSDDWYYGYIRWGVAAGIVSGYEDGTFKPDKVITREEAAVILSRLTNLPTGNNIITFQDYNDIATWARQGVAVMAKTGIMLGDSNGCFNPKKALTSHALEMIVSRLMTGNLSSIIVYN
jgi:hypothetical protein